MGSHVINSWEGLLELLNSESPGPNAVRVDSKEGMPLRMSLPLSTALAMNRSLVELIIPADGSTALICQGLRQNTTLRHLSLNVLDWGLGDELGVAMLAVLKNTTLQYLCLNADRTNMSDKTGAALAQALTQNTSLVSLHFSTQNTSVGDETGIAMAEALWLNDVLRHFSWAADRTKVSDTTGRTLAQAVQQNSKLRSFRFSATGTELSDASGVALAQILKENFALHDFLFDGGESQLGDESGFAFAESLQFSALRSFCLRGSFCNLSEATCEAMAEALSKAHLMSFEFTALHLFANEKLSLCMRNALQRNSSLQSIKFQICQLDGDAACVMLQASIEKALQKIKSERVCENAEEHEAHELGCTCLQLGTRFQGALDTTALSNSDWGSAIVDEQDVKDAGNNFKSKLSCDSLSETDVDAAEAITTISSETPNWESMHGV